MKDARLIVNDVELTAVDLDTVAYESEGININLFHTAQKGFTLSVFDRAKNIMRFYEVKNGELSLKETQDVLTGEESVEAEVLKGRETLRDNIEDRVLELLRQAYYISIGVKPITEDDDFEKFSLNHYDIEDFVASFIIEEYNLEMIEFSKIKEFTKPKHIVDYIEDHMGFSLHDMEDEQEPYINGFEVEA